MQQFIKIITFNLLFVLSALSLSAQILKPVKWSFDQKNISATEAELIFTAKIEKGWTVYSQFTSDDGPVPTALTFEGIDGASLQGPAAEKGHKKEGFDKLFEVNVIKFLDDEDFVMTQKVKVTDTTKPISGYLTYMTCNDKTCLPPTDVDFSFDMSTLSAGSSTTNTTTTKDDTTTTTTQI